MTEEPTGSGASTVNISEAAASIGSSLGAPSGQGSSGSSSAGDTAVGSTGQGGAPSSTPPAQSGVTQAQWDAMPKSWRQEMQNHWVGLPAPVKEYVHTRETQALEGISRYKPGSEAWLRATEPLREVLAQDPDFDTPGLMAALSRNHLAMSKADPATRVQMAKTLLAHYGVDPAMLAGGQPSSAGGSGPTGDAFSPSQMAWLKNALGPAFAQLKEASQFIRSETAKTHQQTVDKFFSDPQNKYANEVADDILNVMQEQGIQDLSMAYQLAVLRNPAVKARYLADLAAGTTPPVGDGFPNVKSSTTPASPGKPATMDETMAAIARKHYGTRQAA